MIVVSRPVKPIERASFAQRLAIALSADGMDGLARTQIFPRWRSRCCFVCVSSWFGVKGSSDSGRGSVLRYIGEGKRMEEEMWRENSIRQGIECEGGIRRE